MAGAIFITFCCALHHIFGLMTLTYSDFPTCHRDTESQSGVNHANSIKNIKASKNRTSDEKS
jgi:hypothetical protein